jgi:hypothetical protein
MRLCVYMRLFICVLTAVFLLFAVQAPVSLATGTADASNNLQKELYNLAADLPMEEGAEENNPTQTAEEEPHKAFKGTNDENRWFLESRQLRMLCQNHDLMKRARESSPQPPDALF